MTTTPATTLTAPIFEAVNISKKFGGIPAAKDVSFSVAPHQIVGLIGPNGAGKSTVLNCLSGIDKPTQGAVRLRGEDITTWSVHKRARAGIGRTFQLLRLFPSLTVSENVAFAVQSTPVTQLAGGPRAVSRRLSAAEAMDRTDEALRHVGLHSLSSHDVGSLTAGQKRLVEVARLVAVDFDVLLLDEPAAGLNPAEGDELFSIIENLASRGKAVLLVEHRIRSVLRVAHDLVVMDHGAVIAHGAPTQVMNLPAVQEAYMGRSDAVH